MAFEWLSSGERVLLWEMNKLGANARAAMLLSARLAAAGRERAKVRASAAGDELPPLLSLAPYHHC